MGSGIGGGIAASRGIGAASNPYNENRQGEQGSIGTSGSLDKPDSRIGETSGNGRNLNLPAVSNPSLAMLKSRGQGSSGGLGSSGS